MPVLTELLALQSVEDVALRVYVVAVGVGAMVLAPITYMHHKKAGQALEERRRRDPLAEGLLLDQDETSATSEE